MWTNQIKIKVINQVRAIFVSHLLSERTHKLTSSAKAEAIGVRTNEQWAFSIFQTFQASQIHIYWQSRINAPKCKFQFKLKINIYHNWTNVCEYIFIRESFFSFQLYYVSIANTTTKIKTNFPSLVIRFYLESQFHINCNW